MVVITPRWESPTGTLAAFTRGPDGWASWRPPIPVTVGHRGLGWGEGLHQSGLDGPQKREGDRRAPAGVFRLEFGFGAQPLRLSTFPYHQVDDLDRWIDDPESRFYNLMTRLDDPRFPKDWSSAEVLRRSDGIYDHVIVVGHNRRPVTPGHGSAIFMHSWFGPGKSTIGCTAMEKKEVIRLLNFLDATANPMLIQIPLGELSRLDLSDGIRRAIDQFLIAEM